MTWCATWVEMQARAFVMSRQALVILLLLICRLDGYYAHAQQAVTGQPPGAHALPEPEPSATDPASGFAARVCRWADDKAAAVALRFDDSSPSHILIAVPLLTRYGMVGTFLINPGKDAYKKYKDRWETEAIQAGHEFGNHTLHHRGAKDDDDADYEIGECSKYIWGLFPGKSKLLAFRSGGGTTWNTTKPWRYYEQKWQLIYDENSAGVATSGGKNYVTDMDLFRQRLAHAIQNRKWITFYYHQIGPAQGLNITEDFLRQQVECLRLERDQLWFGGIAQIHKYQAERRASELRCVPRDHRTMDVHLACTADPKLYDQPLTMQVVPPHEWTVSDVKVYDAEGNRIAARLVSAGGRQSLRFEIKPTNTKLTVCAQ